MLTFKHPTWGKPWERHKWLVAHEKSVIGHVEFQYWEAMPGLWRILDRIIPTQTEASPDEIGVAGSSALQWLQDAKEVKNDWQVKPHDVDVFVCGDQGEEFDHFMRKVLFKLRRSSKTREIDIRVVRRSNHYIQCGTSSAIVDVHLINFFPWRLSTDVQKGDCLISFIQSPFETVKETVESFDIDVCKVMYDVHSGTFTVPDGNTMTHIMTNTASLTKTKFFLSNKVDHSAFDAAKACSTLRRIQKYKARNFCFTNVTGINFFT